MADKRKRIVISAQDDFSQTLRSFDRQMNSAANASAKLNQAGQAAGRGWRESAQSFYFAAQSAQMLAGAVTGVFRTAEGLAVMGREAKNADIALTALAGSGAAADKWTEAIQRGMAGTVTGAQAARQAYQLMRFELAKTPEEAEKFARTIAIISKANPQLGDTSEAISQISLAISNMSYMRLDQLGLRAGTIRQEVARLRKEFKGMTEEEAFSKAVMAGLKEQSDMIGDSILKTSNASERLNVRLKELKTDVGIEIAEGFEGAAVAIESIFGIFEYYDNKANKGWKEENRRREMGIVPVVPPANVFNLQQNEGYGLETAYAGYEFNAEDISRMGDQYWLTEQGRRDAEVYFSALTQREAELFKQRFEPQRTTHLAYTRTTTHGDITGIMEQEDFSPYYARQAQEREQAARYEERQRRKQRLRDMFGGQQEEQDLFQQRFIRARTARRRTITPYTGPLGEEYQGLPPTVQHGQMIPSEVPGYYIGGAGAAREGEKYKQAPGGVASVFPIKEGKEWSSALAQIAAQQEKVNEETTVFNSLAEKFGQVTGGIPVEVYNDFAAALADAGMEQEDINAALDEYEHAAGLATDASDLYAQYVSRLAEKMAEAQENARGGKVETEAFTAAMLAMANASPAVYEAMGKFGEGIKSFVSDPMGAIGGLFGGGKGEKGEKKQGPFEGLGIDEMLPKVQELDTTLTERPAVWAENIDSAFDLSRGYMVTFSDDSVAAFERIATEGIDKLDGRIIHVTLEGVIGVTGDTRGSGTTPTETQARQAINRQHGGWVGGGQVARVNEAGAPELFAVGGHQFVMAPRGGGTVIPMREITPAALVGAGGSSEHYSPVYLDGKELQHSWIHHRLVQNKGT